MGNNVPLKRIDYKTKDIYTKCQLLLENSDDFIIEIFGNKNINILDKILPYMLNITSKRPSVLDMLISTIKFHQLYAVIGLVHQNTKYNLTYKIKNYGLFLKIEKAFKTRI